ncbi:MAG: MFS transporter [Actinomycetota bacterium]
MTAAAVGSVMQWYDFAVYSYMAPVVSQLFFPSDDPLDSLIATFGVFAAGFLAGPVGAVFFGHVGDKVGRKPMLIISIVMMGLATAAIGLLPVESSVGWLAGAGLVVCRLLQGFASSGEYGGSVAFIAEHSPPSRRGFTTSFVLIGSNIGFLAGAGVAAVVTDLFSDDTLDSWAWRVPFLLGGLVALGGLVLRNGLREPPLPPDYEPPLETPIKVALRYNWREMLQVFGLVLTVNAGYYLVFVYVLSYLTNVVDFDGREAVDINTFAIVLMCFLPLGSALLSDRIGRKPVLYIGNLAVLVLTVPLFIMIDSAEFVPVLVAQTVFAVIFSWLYGAGTAAQIEVAPRAVRATVMIVPSNLANATFIGTMPLVAAYLVNRTGNDLAPAFYLMAMSVVTLLAVRATREMAGKPLD